MQKTRALMGKAIRHVWISYWLVPSLILLAAIILAIVTLSIDRHFLSIPSLNFLLLQQTQPESAQAFLSTIASSVIGVAGVVFSITMVAVSFASGTFGPRLIGNFMRDRGNQASLGIFIGSFLYNLMILREVRGGDFIAERESGIVEFVPQFSISISLLSAVICTIVLIYFIHHIPETINIERIIARLGREMKAGVSKRFPGLGSASDSTSDMREMWERIYSGMAPTEVECSTEGYIQSVDLRALNRIAEHHEMLVELCFRPGAFVTKNTCIIKIWSVGDCSVETKKAMIDCVTTGFTQTVTQNVEFVVDQLIEIVGRALSPGVNDPFTAIACLNWLQVGILEFACAENDNKIDAIVGRVKVPSLEFDDFVKAIFTKAFPYIETDRNVTRHTERLLGELLGRIEAREYRQTITVILDELMVRIDGS